MVIIIVSHAKNKCDTLPTISYMQHVWLYLGYCPIFGYFNPFAKVYTLVCVVQKEHFFMISSNSEASASLLGTNEEMFLITENS